jgi:hypothetical protein
MREFTSFEAAADSVLALLLLVLLLLLLLLLRLLLRLGPVEVGSPLLLLAPASPFSCITETYGDKCAGQVSGLKTWDWVADIFFAK